MIELTVVVDDAGCKRIWASFYNVAFRPSAWNPTPIHNVYIWLDVAFRFTVPVSVHLTSCKLYSLYSHATSALGILILVRPPRENTTFRLSQSLIGLVFDSVYFRQKA
jgi:hypothetical protein